MTRRFMVMLGITLSLAACHDKQADGGKSAVAAEVLPGSASDAMIAYDTLKSQPPAAAPEYSGASENDKPATEPRKSGDLPDTAPAAARPSDPAPAASGPVD